MCHVATAGGSLHLQTRHGSGGLLRLDGLESRRHGDARREPRRERKQFPASSDAVPSERILLYLSIDGVYDVVCSRVGLTQLTAKRMSTPRLFIHKERLLPIRFSETRSESFVVQNGSTERIGRR